MPEGGGISGFRCAVLSGLFRETERIGVNKDQSVPHYSGARVLLSLSVASGTFKLIGSSPTFSRLLSIILTLTPWDA